MGEVSVLGGIWRRAWQWGNYVWVPCTGGIWAEISAIQMFWQLYSLCYFLQCIHLTKAFFCLNIFWLLGSHWLFSKVRTKCIHCGLSFYKLSVLSVVCVWLLDMAAMAYMSRFRLIFPYPFRTKPMVSQFATPLFSSSAPRTGSGNWLHLYSVYQLIYPSERKIRGLPFLNSF